MADLLLGISGRIEVGETLTATSLSPVPLQWQALVNGTWTNVGTGATTYVIPSGAAGLSYRLTATEAGQTFYSAATAPATADANKVTAPTLAGPAVVAQLQENGPALQVSSHLAFTDPDKGNYTGGSLLVLNTQNSPANLDVLSIRFAGTGAGQFSFNAATGDLLYAFTAGTATAIGKVDPAQNGSGTDLKVVFNANATKAVVDALIDNITISNSDDSPALTRLLTLRVTDPTGGSAQRAVTVNVQAQADAPVFTSGTSFTVDENQAAVATMAAFDPDQEANAQQGMTYSLVEGAGGGDGEFFTIDAATGVLRFQAPPDYEDPAHAPQYTVRVRATDAGGSTVEQVITVSVADRNDAPVAQALAATAQENGPAVTLVADYADADAQDTHTITFGTAGTMGNVSFDGQVFTYDAAGRFESLAQGATATDTFTYTVTDAAGLSSTRIAAITVVGSNDAATIAGTATAALADAPGRNGGVLTAAGALTVADPDQGQAALVPQAEVLGTLGWGRLNVDAAGAWSYAVDALVVESLGENATAVDRFTVTSADGTASQEIAVTLYGANDAPHLLFPTLQSVTEAGVNGPGTPTVGDRIIAFDWDTGDSVTLSGSAQGVYGALTVDSATGNWVYTLDNEAPATQALQQSSFGLAQEHFTISATDSHGATTQSELTIQVWGRNDAPEITGGDWAAAIEVPQGRSGQLHLGDPGYNLRDTAVDSAGRLIVASMDPSTQTATLHRFNTDGTEDTAFANGPVEYGLSQITTDSAGRVMAWGYGIDDYATKAIDFAVRRFNADGTADTGFGAGGIAMVDIGGSYDYASELMIDASGKLLVAGTAGHFAIARMNEDGSLDTGFGVGGRWTFENDPVVNSSFHAALDGAGRLVLWGETMDEGTGLSQISVLRYFQDGTLDAGFGVAGKATITIPQGAGYSGPELAIGPDDGLVVGWNTSIYNGDGTWTQDINLARLGPDGSADPAFGEGGRVALSGLQSSFEIDLAIDAQGRTLVSFGGQQIGVSVARLGTDGSLDTSFSGDGIAGVGLSAQDTMLAGLDLSLNGEIVLSGVSYQSSADMVVTTLNVDGTLDTDFGASLGATVSGDVFATDPELSAVSWSGSAQGAYGSFNIDAGGHWSFDLDPGSAATLPAGQVATDVFMATATDNYGASATHEVVITIVGTYEVPAP